MSAPFVVLLSHYVGPIALWLAQQRIRLCLERIGDGKDRAKKRSNDVATSAHGSAEAQRRQRLSGALARQRPLSESRLAANVRSTKTGVAATCAGAETETPPCGAPLAIQKPVSRGSALPPILVRSVQLAKPDAAPDADRRASLQA
jgi:hypothetical protein